MQVKMNTDVIEKMNSVKYLVGNDSMLEDIKNTAARLPFDNETIDFLNAFSKNLISAKESKIYSDVITLGFWMRKSSMIKLKERFAKEDGDIHIGRGVAFHIAPSNVPVNYAYSLVAGLITGNINIVRIPSKDFPQISIINKAINETLKEYPDMKNYIYLVRYDREHKINDVLSSVADTRIIWGGDTTISELRESPLAPRAGEITFADRYSLAVIDSDKYLTVENKDRFAEDFYNDTFLTDQNACTSPRIVVWTGKEKKEAKDEFWKTLHQLVEKKYTFQPIMGVNKLISSYLMAAIYDNVKIIEHNDNLIIRVKIDNPTNEIMKLRDNSGYFFEYDCDDIMEIKDLCDDRHCQTIGYLGDSKDIMPLLASGIKGVDRVVPIGKTMDFDLIWDGYNLYERLTRTINIGVR